MLAVLAGSFLLAWLASIASHWGQVAALLPGWSVWHRVLEPGREKYVYATIELRDGRRFGGYVSVYDIEADKETRDIALRAPVFSVATDGIGTHLPVHYMLFHGSEIGWMSVVYQPPPEWVDEIPTRKEAGEAAADAT
jgi:Family of unknown function (DUF6338)